MPKPGFRLNPEIIRKTRERVPRAFLQRWIREITRALDAEINLRKSVAPRGGGENSITFVFVSKAEIRSLNRKFRSKDKATDVLSFSPTEEGSLGELVFSLEVLRRQAADHGLSLQQELGYMVLHGTLHLLGYDHERSKREAEEMFRIQDKIFDAVLSRW